MPKVSIHIDGGHFLKQLWSVRSEFEKSVENAVKGINWAVSVHLKRLNTMWRSASPDLFEHIDGLYSGLRKKTSEPE